MADIDLHQAKCNTHGKPCMLKTGTKEGVNKGKCYLICSNTAAPCDYRMYIQEEPKTCTKHQSIVELVCPSVKDGEKRIYLRCAEGKKAGKWCSYSVCKQKSLSDSEVPSLVEKPQKTYSTERTLKAVRDLNVLPKKTDTCQLDVKAKSQPVKVLTLAEYKSSKKTHVDGEFKTQPVQSEVRPKTSFTDRRHQEPLLAPRPDVSHQSDTLNSIAPRPEVSIIHSASQPDAAKAYIVSEIEKKKRLLKMAGALPDKGAKIQAQLQALEQALQNTHISDPVKQTSTEHRSMAASSQAQHMRTITIQSDGRMVMNTDAQRLPPHVLREMYTQSGCQDQLYGGRMTDKRLQVVTSVTTEAIEMLHKQLESCPLPEEESSDPKDLNVTLMTHQRQALKWLKWREQQNPAGGILADDMGLGKTLTMISLVMKDKQSRKSIDDSVKQPQWLNKDGSIILSQGTLIVCPASLVHQWAKEVEARCKRSSLSVIVYHGTNREKSITRLSCADIVLTTYNLVQREVQLPESLKKDKYEQEKAACEDQVVEGDGLLARIAWKRIVLDEAHNIKNARSTTALSVCRLRAQHRWALTGTPIQNDVLDFYSLLRFLRCSPFDELKVWKRWVDNKQLSGDKRLKVLIKSLLLRRTKDQKTASGKALVPLPEKNFVTHQLDLGSYERKLYDQLFAKCKTVLVKYLSSKADDSVSASAKPTAGGSERVKGDTILLMLLRLRQCCSHPTLTKTELVEEELNGEGVELDLVSAMKELDIQENKSSSGDATDSSVTQASITSSEESCKIIALVDKVEEVKAASPDRKVKFVVVSQWTSMLELVAKALKAQGLSQYTIRGDVSPKKRSEMVHDFNTNPSSPPVMLVSLRAGGVGLNLIGASNLFIMDLHWNPALEQQACDRIYRVGQKSDVVIHKFVCKDTIEQQILLLQQKKLDLASNALTGAKTADSKLTLNDLKMLFGLDTNQAKFGGF